MPGRGAALESLDDDHASAGSIGKGAGGWACRCHHYHRYLQLGLGNFWLPSSWRARAMLSAQAALANRP